MTTEERLAKVERELERAKRRSRWLLVGLALGLGALALVWASVASEPRAEAQGAAGTGPKIIRANAFVLEDERGRGVAELVVTAEGPGLRLLDENGKVRAGMVVFKGRPGLYLFDENGKTRVELGVVKDGPELILRDESGRNRAVLSLIKDGPGLCLFEENGEACASLGVFKGRPGLMLLDAAGKPIWSAP